MDSFGQRDNADRADAAAAALEAYTATNSTQYAEETTETRIGDLICDLLHLARRAETEPHDLPDPTSLLDRARSNFEEEESEEADETCSECGATLDDGEGYDGLCGACADVEDEESEGFVCPHCDGDYQDATHFDRTGYCSPACEASNRQPVDTQPSGPPYRVRWVERTEFIALVMDAKSPEAAIQEAIDAGPQSAIESEVCHVIEKGLLP